MYKSRQRIRYFVKTLFGKIPPNCMLHADDFASMPAKALPITPLSHCEPRSTEGLPVMLLIRRQMSDTVNAYVLASSMCHRRIIVRGDLTAVIVRSYRR